MKLAIVTPSYINSSERVHYAKKSLQSLVQAFGSDKPHIVVNDFPRGSGILTRWIPNLKWRNAGKFVYHQPNVTLIQQNRRGSNPATLTAVQEAQRQGADLIFLHLDDNVYSANMTSLIEYACDAFKRDPELLTVMFSSYPLISRQNFPEGNKKFIKIEEDGVSFDEVTLKPSRFEAYTLWWSYFHSRMAAGNFWPIAMWNTMYRSDFIAALLSFEYVSKLPRLGQVEKYYKNESNLKRLLENNPGKVGFINMQYGGLEMHRNKDWEDLLKMPNISVK